MLAKTDSNTLPLVVIQKACPLCESSELKPVCTERNRFSDGVAPIVKAFDRAWIQLLQCERCEFAFTKELPYSPDFFPARYDIRFDPEAESRNPFKDHVLDDIFALLSKHGRKSGRFLDIGSFAGILLRKAKEKGFDVEGIEVNPTMASYCREKLGIPTRQGTFLDAEVKEASYGVITLIDVLEHLTEPRRVLSKVHRSLEPGGDLVIKVPNFQPQLIKQRVANLLRVSNLGVFENYGHINHFSPRSLGRILKEMGFEVLETTVAASERLPDSNAKNRAKNLLRGCVSRVSEAVRKGTGLNLGLNIIVLARKKR